MKLSMIYGIFSIDSTLNVRRVNNTYQLYYKQAEATLLRPKSIHTLVIAP